MVDFHRPSPPNWQKFCKTDKSLSNLSVLIFLLSKFYAIDTVHMFQEASNNDVMTFSHVVRKQSPYPWARLPIKRTRFCLHPVGLTRLWLMLKWKRIRKVVYHSVELNVLHGWCISTMEKNSSSQIYLISHIYLRCT